jgi:hypothetical protein
MNQKVDIDKLRQKDKILRAAAAVLHAEPEALLAVIAKFKREIAAAEREIRRLK